MAQQLVVECAKVAHLFRVIIGADSLHIVRIYNSLQMFIRFGIVVAKSLDASSCRSCERCVRLAGLAG